MTPDELTEKVALVLSGVEWCGAQINGVRVLCDDPHLPEDVRQGECLCRKQAPAAIAVLRPALRAEALEQAAKVADGYHRIVETRRDMFDDGNITVTRGHTLADPRKIAAAIRNLIGEK